MRRPPRTALPLLALLAPLATSPPEAPAQEVGREAALALEFPPLEFDPPRAELREVEGVKVLFLEDPSLPLVNVFARFEGGFSHFDRDYYAAATALPALLRSAGTRDMTPDSLDEVMEFYALSTAFGGGGRSSFSSINMLREHLDVGLETWASMLRHPRFDPQHVEVWRGQSMENVRRRSDDPARLAFSEFNRIMFGDHPIGWEMEASDLEPEDLAREKLIHVHRRVFCPENMILGITGAVSWDEARPRLERILGGWPPCVAPLGEAPVPDMRREGRVFLIPRKLDQSTVVMAQPAGVREGDGEPYFASRIGNSILGASGFTSRLMEQVRTERGWAYSASSLWTAPREYEGIMGALTRTRGETTLSATRLILDLIGEMTEEAPTRDEVDTAIEEIVSGFVFNFESPSQVISRQMFYLAQDLPEDWLERWLDGIQGVRPIDVLRVFRRNVDPRRMTILVVGDPERFEEPLSALGRPLTVLGPDGGPADADTVGVAPEAEGARPDTTGGGFPPGTPAADPTGAVTTEAVTTGGAPRTEGAGPDTAAGAPPGAPAPGPAGAPGTVSHPAGPRDGHEAESRRPATPRAGSLAAAGGPYRTPTWSAAIPPVRREWEAEANPDERISSSSSSGPGNSFTDSGR